MNGVQIRGETWHVADDDGRDLRTVRDATVTIDGLGAALRLWWKLTLAILGGLLRKVL